MKLNKKDKNLKFGLRFVKFFNNLGLQFSSPTAETTDINVGENFTRQ